MVSRARHPIILNGSKGRMSLTAILFGVARVQHSTDEIGPNSYDSICPATVRWRGSR